MHPGGTLVEREPRWTYTLVPAGDSTTLRIVEDGEVYNPIFRLVSRFVLGHNFTIDQFLRDIGKKVGEDRPLEPRDSVFLTKVLTDLSDCTLYVKCADEMESQEMADQCEQMKLWLEDSIDQTFNRPPGNTTQGIFRGRNGVGSMDQTESVHGGATSNGAAHADEFEWQIYAADSLHQGRNLVNILMHESVHQHSYNHGPQGHENYASYPYFKYVISGSFHGCVRI